MGLNRRTFLQRAILALASLGIGETALSLLGDQSLAIPILDRYFQALAQPGGRKLALLVGINQYPHGAALSGCLTDVELQRELLVHRFGFNSSNVLTLTDSQATRENIETAFIEHLSNQAKASDVVVFHFSGYGSQMMTNQTDSPIRFSNSLVPVDSLLNQGAATDNDLLEETLILLLRSLSTTQVTTVLDTSYTPVQNLLQGNLRVRSCPNPPATSPSLGELAFQEQLLLRLKSSLEQIKSTQLPGIVLAAASPTQPATEALWNGFSAGLFTYALTQYLWQASPATTVQISVSRAAGMVKQLAGKEQQPRLLGQKSRDSPLFAYYLPPDSSLGADGVVTAVEDGGKIQLWLAGLPATVLEYYGSNSLLSLVPSQSAWGTDAAVVNPTALQLQLRSKEGLKGFAKIVSTTTTTENYPLAVGQLVREAVRVLPRNLGLSVAMDVRLERIERVDATSAFASIPAVTAVVVAGEQPADYLFGPAIETKFVDSVRLEGGDALTRTRGYGLFYLGSEPIRSTTGASGEAVKSAVNRLTPKLKALLAAKLLRLTANEGSSLLGVRASLERVAPQATVVMQRETLRASLAVQGLGEGQNQRIGEATVPSLPIGSRVRYRLENFSDAEVYFMLLGFDAGGNAIALYQMRSLAPALDNPPTLVDAVIAPGKSLRLPQSVVTADWVISGPSGLAEMQLICSRAPFKSAIAILELSRNLKQESEQIGDLLNPLDVAQAILQDLHSGSAMLTTDTTVPDATTPVSDAYSLNVNAWATLSFIYQVV